ncbi:MAG: hypothetical protein JEY91_18425 [Spirochaetaceae bacterium]|nr:hypothetical protein [Spirochaetaceae bacterium]
MDEFKTISSDWAYSDDERRTDYFLLLEDTPQYKEKVAILMLALATGRSVDVLVRRELHQRFHIIKSVSMNYDY